MKNKNPIKRRMLALIVGCKKCGSVGSLLLDVNEDSEGFMDTDNKLLERDMVRIYEERHLDKKNKTK